jgi:hypothetical protein
LLADLAHRVMRHVGCASVPTEELAAALAQATAGGTFGGAQRCDVQFRARRHTLDILVSAGGGRIWQSSCQIP